APTTQPGAARFRRSRTGSRCRSGRAKKPFTDRGNRSADRGVLDPMGQPVWRSRRGAIAIAVAALIVGISALFIVLGIRNQKGSDAASLPPIMPTADAPYASSEPSFRIPPAFTAADDARARIPLSQPEVHWVFADGPNLPPLVSPCGGYLPSDGARVGAHQLALVSPTTAKPRRVVLYRDVDSARQAMSERRSALEQCAHHDDGNGIATVWI